MKSKWDVLCDYKWGNSNFCHYFIFFLKYGSKNTITTHITRQTKLCKCIKIISAQHLDLDGQYPIFELNLLGILACDVLLWYSRRKCMISCYAINWSMSGVFVRWRKFQVTCVYVNECLYQRCHNLFKGEISLKQQSRMVLWIIHQYPSRRWDN